MCDQDNDAKVIAGLAKALLAEAHTTFQRRLLLLTGSVGWCEGEATELIRRLNISPRLWVGSGSADSEWSLQSNKVGAILGRELELVVFNAFSGFDLSALGAVAGALRGGGLLIWLAPPLEQWHQFNDPDIRRLTVYPYSETEMGGRFLTRLARIVAESGHCWQIEERRGVVSRGAINTHQATQLGLGEWLPEGVDCATLDQQKAVIEVVSQIKVGEHSPLVITSDRGRGKTAALGIACARLLSAGCRRIVATAPRRDAVEALFEHTKRLLPGCRYRHNKITIDGGELLFMSPDSLIANREPGVELLLVDEAAAIPTAMLTQLLEIYPRTLFASTVHGYEGTGRGFAIRFQAQLDTSRPAWRRIELKTPIRWSMGDPLEQLLSRCLLLNSAPLLPPTVRRDDQSGIAIERIDRDNLIANEELLSALFGLLVNAHYRTSPLDLRLLLDAPNVEAWVVRDHGAVIATALTALEGPFEPSLAEQIWLCTRRTRGNLLAQTLLAQAGLLEGGGLRYMRVMRIAVEPALQGKGIGSRLLAAISERAGGVHCDGLGASFGATAELTRFWQKNGMDPLHLGIGRGKSSGLYSVVVLKPLSVDGEGLHAMGCKLFAWRLSRVAERLYSRLDPALLTLLQGGTAGTPWRQQELIKWIWRELIAFSHGERGYELSLASLLSLPEVLPKPTDGKHTLSTEVLELLEILTGSTDNWGAVAVRLGVPGKGAAVTKLRRGLAPLIKDSIQRLADRRLVELLEGVSGEQGSSEGDNSWVQ